MAFRRRKPLSPEPVRIFVLAVHSSPRSKGPSFMPCSNIPPMPDTPAVSKPCPALISSQHFLACFLIPVPSSPRAEQGLSCSWLPCLARCLAHCRCWITICPINTRDYSKFTSTGRSSEVDLTLIFLSGLCVPIHWP